MTATTGAAGASGPYRVMVVEDATVIRAMLNRTLEQDPQIEVVTSVINGEMAVSALQRDPEIDVILLDIDMPVMDGLTALPKLLAVKPEAKVIMNSTLTRANADISLRALAMGAADYLTKPSSSQELRSAEAFSRELTEKVKALGAAARGQAPAPVTGPSTSTARPAAAISLRGGPAQQPSALAIGSSTGGPQALFKVLGGFAPPPPQPIFITQHMPPTFTTLLAEHIGRQTGLACHEPDDGEAVVGGRVYLAPGDRHMLVESGTGSAVIRLSDGPQENFCRPAVDPMLRSLAEVYGSRLLVAILTGMGTDGREGGRSVVEAGGAVIAQDEESSVVWGMPGAVATAGLCSAVLPLAEIAPYICKVAMRSAA
ncbi:MAG: chemotaxis response regulator protein-glutamate methylesterase [Kiloniellales bacterium]|nr:chemotaxis response regulator protein-glutamate methylesterase [Kiloniellales bacterium]